MLVKRPSAQSILAVTTVVATAITTVLISAALIAACSASSNDSFDNKNSEKDGGPGTNDGDSGGHTDLPSGEDGSDVGTDGPGYEIPDADKNFCNSDPDEDLDGDGWTKNQGDCNDCNASINPGAFDDPDDNIDNDCDGIIDNGADPCDAGLAIGDNNPIGAARAIGLCKQTTLDAPLETRTWGVISAKYVKADGTPGMKNIGHGLLPKFGVNNPRHGNAMLALSSGEARAPGQPGYMWGPSGAIHDTFSDPPEGYPKESAACPDIVTDPICNDPAALELEIRVPTNAKSFSFNFNFFTFEYPEYICSVFNDFFVTLMWPKHPDLPDPNIAFDIEMNPISVNNGLLQVCTKGTHGGKTFDCPLGAGALQGTGFLGHAATGWLVTQAPVEPASILKLRFAIWDSGDAMLDSTVLIDNFRWDTETVESIATTPDVIF